MRRRFAAGPPNGRCKNDGCSREAKSPQSEYCSQSCRDEHKVKQQRIETQQEEHEDNDD